MVIFDIFKLKKQLSASEEKIGLGVVIVWKGCQNVSIIGIFRSVFNLSITNLNISRLGYVSSQSIGLELNHVDPFLACAPILHPLRTQGNQKASGVLQGV